jgi:hypothetical protein
MENIKLSWVATPRGVRDRATTALLCSEPVILNLGRGHEKLRTIKITKIFSWNILLAGFLEDN